MACLHCDLPDLLEASMPPDEEMVDLIERAFLEGQIDGLTADLAYWLLRADLCGFWPKCYPDCYPKR